MGSPLSVMKAFSINSRRNGKIVQLNNLYGLKSDKFYLEILTLWVIFSMV